MKSPVARLSLLMILPTLALTGCSRENPAAPQQPSVQWTKPGVGSMFIYNAYRTDSTGAKIPGTDVVAGETVSAVGISDRGVDGLVRFENAGGSRLVDYRSNGDLAYVMEDPDGVPYPWTVVPVGSRGSTERAPWSLSLGDPSTGISTWSVPGATTRYVGSETITVPAGSFAAHRLVMTTRDSTYEGIPYSDVDTFWYAPTVGTFVKQSQPANMIESKKGFVLEMTSFQLK
jgi:hypothetical protein